MAVPSSKKKSRDGMPAFEREGSSDSTMKIEHARRFRLAIISVTTALRVY
jgi:hypothetical protein